MPLIFLTIEEKENSPSAIWSVDSSAEVQETAFNKLSIFMLRSKVLMTEFLQKMISMTASGLLLSITTLKNSSEIM